MANERRLGRGSRSATRAPRGRRSSREDGVPARAVLCLTGAGLFLVRSGTSESLQSLAPGLRALPLSSNRGLLVEGAAFHLLEQAPREHLLLEGLERRFYLVVEHLDLHRATSPPQSRSLRAAPAAAFTHSRPSPRKRLAACATRQKTPRRRRGCFNKNRVTGSAGGTSSRAFGPGVRSNRHGRARPFASRTA
jgi:hypothetical protein